LSKIYMSQIDPYIRHVYKYTSRCGFMYLTHFKLLN